MTTESLKSLIKQRGAAKGQLTRLHNFLTSSDNLTLPVVETRKLKVEEFYNNWCNIQTQIECLDDTVNHETDREELEVIYYACSDIMSEYIHKLNLNNQPSSSASSEISQSSNQNMSQSILPKINIKQFNGDFIEWHSFHDTFKSLVHDSNTITAVHKFHLLKSYLTGDASAVIDSLYASEENYLVAWNLLQKRFNNPRKIIHSHLQALFELPEVTKESSLLLKSLSERAEMHVNALRALNQPVDWHEMLIYIISAKLDKQSRIMWERSLEDDKIPTFSDFISFLNKISRDSQPVPLFKGASSDRLRVNQLSQKRTSVQHNKRDTHSYTSSQVNLHCAICSQEHSVHNCDNFLKLTPQQRLEAVKKAQLCINCLRSGHKTPVCRSRSCKKCQGRHNSLLHFNSNPNVTQVNNYSNITQDNNNFLPSNIDTQPSTSTFTTIQNNEVLLSTARVIVLDNQQREHECRVLLDGGSQSNFMTERLANTLNLRKQEIFLPASGLGQTQRIVRYSVKTTIRDKENKFVAEQKFLLLPVITAKLPSRCVDRKGLNIPKNLRLADPEFHKPAEIDMLLGEYIFYKLLCVGQIRLANETTVLQKTRLGWLVSGRVSNHSLNSTFCHSITLDSQIERFWKLENISYTNHLSKEELACQTHFQNNIARDHSGRYIVRLPFKENLNHLGNSYNTSLKRFHSLENKLTRNTALRHEYCEFMNEYINLGHMSNITNSSSNNLGFYLPHHAVIKEKSLTTKVRVVFDGSNKSDTGLSLNDTLMVGPTIQDDIFTLITRFRTHKYVLTADIEKMYRQIKVHEEDCQYQKILWRDNPSEPVQTYQLNTVTYGTASAPFLAVRCLKQLAIDEESKFPLAAVALTNDFYVDDLLTGTSTLEEARKLSQELIQLCQLGGFNLHKWSSNEPLLLQDLKHISHEPKVCLDYNTNKKTLGIYWDHEDDSIKYEVPSSLSNVTATISKRTMLSQISQIFDPLGLLGPVIILAKLFMQNLWLHKLDWDESVPQSIFNSWLQYKKQLCLLNHFKVPRYLKINSINNQLHGFCDASEKAYGACIYLRSEDVLGNITSRLIAAKSRVAPLKTTSLPRLELCAATLLTNLVTSTKVALKININSIKFWSDSTITLHWINTEPYKLKTFVSNRVAEIQGNSNSMDWSHVPSEDNPADYISRGQLPSEFLQNKSWVQGPSWLLQEEQFWPRNIISQNTNIPEQKITAMLTINNSYFSEILTRFSSFSKLQRIFAYIRRFISNSRKITNFTGTLTTHELAEAHVKIMTVLQGDTFAKEIADIKKGCINSKNKLISLNPFLDSKGILRVGGRLKNANLQYSKKHPILLPRSHHVTRLIIHREHIKQMHAGILGTLNSVRQTYWPIDGKNTTRHVIRKCLICFRSKPACDNNYIMADLPQSRFNATKPFYNVGIDYCGPFFIKEKEFRNLKKLKVYVAVFVCFLTKAIHLELVGNLSSESCFSAIKRFLCRRGYCKNIYTDNATNFVGVKNQLKELYEYVHSKEYKNKLFTELGTRGINWHFSPPSSPHFGGLWEAAVKSFKHHFVRVVGETLFTYEQLYTYVVEIEAILNSRPLTPLSSDPNDPEALTPNHFLLGESNSNLPEHDLTSTPINHLSAWKHIQKLKQHFWARWNKEYLNELHIRSKWKHGTDNNTSLKIGTMVILKEDNQPPRHWKLGRIEAVHPGKDNVIRVVTIKTASGSLTRSVKKVCVLPVLQ